MYPGWTERGRGGTGPLELEDLRPPFPTAYVPGVVEDPMRRIAEEDGAEQPEWPESAPDLAYVCQEPGCGGGGVLERSAEPVVDGAPGRSVAMRGFRDRVRQNAHTQP